MNFRFYKALPDANVQWPLTPDDGQPGPFVLVALERTNDPDANNHTGFDYFGAYGDSTAMTAWANNQPVQNINKADLPKPVTFYPTPFTQA